MAEPELEGGLKDLADQLKEGKISRRDFLRLTTLFGFSVAAAEAVVLTGCTSPPPVAAPTPVVNVAAATAVPPAAAPAQQAAPAAMAPGREYYSPAKGQAFIEAEEMKCTGCNLCQFACSMQHYNVINVQLSRIHIEQRLLPLLKGIEVTCAQCQKEERECEKACPVNPPAIYFDDKTLHMVVDEKRCLGMKCDACVTACTAGAITRYAAQTPAPIVCDLCDVKNEGKRDPQCVQVCPASALHFKDSTPHHWWRNSMDQKADDIAKRMYPLPRDNWSNPERKV